MATEITFELTDYCPHKCKFCSSSAGTPHLLLDVLTVLKHIKDKKFDIINLSGGEPMAHPQLWRIINMCRGHLTELGELWIYTNAFDGIRYNTHVRDRVKIHANVTIDEDTDEVHVLKRQKHGREAKRPEIKASGEDCASCNHIVIRPNGDVEKPCKKG
jgi:organic radical activating enzyme